MMTDVIDAMFEAEVATEQEALMQMFHEGKLTEAELAVIEASW